MNGIVKIHHMRKHDGPFLNCNEFCIKYQNVITNFLVFNVVIAAIRSYARNMNLFNEMAEDMQEPVGW